MQKFKPENEVGYDAMIQASAGLMSVTGERGGKPQKVGVAIADIMTGMYAATAILASLYQGLKQAPFKISMCHYMILKLLG